MPLYLIRVQRNTTHEGTKGMQLTILQETSPCQLTQTDEIPLYSGDLEADLLLIGSRKQAMEIVGGLSKPSKMPCYTYNLPASKCKTGAKLATIPGSVCFGCYAADNVAWKQRQAKHDKRRFKLSRYCMHQTQHALKRRFESLQNPLWVPAMVYLIRHFAKPNTSYGRPAIKYFRWHDSGDVQSVNHFRNIIQIAEATSNVKHWMPTREYGIVTPHKTPENLIVRLSAHMENSAPPSGYGLPTSTVSTGDKPENGGLRCHANEREGSCGKCRKCWNPNIKNIDYKKH